MVTLVSYHDSIGLGHNDTKLIAGLLRQGECNWVAQTCQLESVGANSEQIPARVEKILKEFNLVFSEPTTLPREIM